MVALWLVVIIRSYNTKHGAKAGLMMVVCTCWIGDDDAMALFVDIVRNGSLRLSAYYARLMSFRQFSTKLNIKSVAGCWWGYMGSSRLIERTNAHSLQRILNSEVWAVSAFSPQRICTAEFVKKAFTELVREWINNSQHHIVRSMVNCNESALNFRLYFISTSDWIKFYPAIENIFAN